jgi:hypothetical protein
MSADGFPPPPPPGLSPPPGAVGYQSGPWGAVTLERVGGLAKALTVVLIVNALGQIVTALFLRGQIDNARDLIAERIDDDTFLERQLGFSGVSLLTGGTTLAAAVLTMIWLYRVARNHRSLRRQTTWAPGWAVGGWFLPPLLYVIPTLMVREHWKAADPSSPPGDDSWRRGPEPWLVWVWFFVYSVAPILVLFRGDTTVLGPGFGANAEDLAESLVDAESSLWMSAALSFIAAILWLVIVRGLTARHRQLTGEASL